MGMEWFRPVGRSISGLRAGTAQLASEASWLRPVQQCIEVRSSVFGHGDDIPVRFTADGAGVSPPLSWKGLPAPTRSVLLLIEDADTPLPVPLVHGLFYAIPIGVDELAEGALPSSLGRGESPIGFHAGRAGYGRTGWIPPSPPPGHGPHHYAFQVFALDTVPVFQWPPSRGFVMRRIRDHVIGRGTLFGIYERA